MHAAANHEWSAAEYRRLSTTTDLVSFSVQVKQTDLRVSAELDLRSETLALVQAARAELEPYVGRHPEFLHSLVPVDVLPGAPRVAVEMAQAARIAGVGPMAAVAGAIAEHVGRGLAHRSFELIAENGGDIWLRSRKRRELTVLAENTQLQGLRIAIGPQPDGIGIATSAGTIGPSLSLGRADAVMIMAATAALADALATAVGNRVQGAADLQRALDAARALGARGAVIIAGGSLGAFGDIELIE